MSDIAVQSPWLTQAEAAKYAKRGIRLINEALRNGELRGHQSGRNCKWLINVADLDAWIRGEIADAAPPRIASVR